jgi:Uma2 family endonuclease
MTIAARQFTIDDLANFPDDGSRYEVIDGELYVSTAPHFEHQLIQSNVSIPLTIWSEANDDGVALCGAGVIFSRHDGVIPDILWFSGERLPTAILSPLTGEKDGKFHLAPDLAVEIVSPGKVNEERDRETKLILYSRRGVREYWIVDRFARAILVYRRESAELELVATLTDGDVLTSPFMSGFSLAVERIFRLPQGV